MRVDKLFSSLGLLSRSECKKAVRAGDIVINGVTAGSPDMPVDPERDEVLYRGSPVDCSPYVYYMLNKPEGYVTARSDSRDKTVFELVKDPRPDLAAVGRLDKDTTGILLITNDGQLNHRLLSPKRHVPKKYIINAEGMLTEKQLEMLREGIDIGDEKPTLPAEARVIGKDEKGSVLELVIVEGRYHQVKRMLEAADSRVIKLHRSEFGPLKLDEGLKSGEIRPLTDEEKEKLLKL